MYKIFIYSCRDDEKVLYEKYQKEWNLDLGFCKEQPLKENARLAAGYPCISIVGTIVSDDLLREFANLGVKMIATRSIGYEHVNIALARELGITVANIVYSPNAVADFAILLMLMSLRKAKYILNRYAVKDYTLAWNRGRELRNMTVGIIGTGRIGRTVIRQLSGFGCKILAYDKFPSKEMEQSVEYVSLDALYERADLISFHAPSTTENHHMFNHDSLKKVKKGLVLINTSRGALVDNKALISGLEQGIISAVGMDVIDEEPVVYNVDHKNSLFIHHDIAILESYPNVIITPHTAFFTDQAVQDMIENSLKNCVCFFKGEKIPGKVN